MVVVLNAPLIAFAMALGWLKKKKKEEKKKMNNSDFRFTLLLLVQTGAGFTTFRHQHLLPGEVCKSLI